VETDFYGGGTENKNIPMLRHAYLKVDFNRWYMLAGQTSDVISPLFPATVNYTVLWNSGNIGYRRPQFQAGAKLSNFQLIGAVGRNISGDADNDTSDDGEDSGLPLFEGSLSYVTPRLNVGVSGHYGASEYRDANLEDTTYRTSSINGHLSWNVTKQLVLKGEAFSGQNLAQFFGGIGQNFALIQSATLLEEDVNSAGGWANATMLLNNGNSVTLGYGLDNPEENEAINFPQRAFNSTLYGNTFITIAPNTQIAAELSYPTTKYFTTAGQQDTISGLRIQTAFIFNF
ncbi:MAG: hypothetical protein ACYC9O_19780, partial [Candidatus Latescibacterota bacterium]